MAGVALPAATGAQTPQPAPPHETPRVAPPNTGTQTPPEMVAPADRSVDSSAGKTLSDKLSQQQGTLKPPAVDPGIHAPMPAQSKDLMPVIPPPGSPGGDPKVVPK